MSQSKDQQSEIRDAYEEQMNEEQVASGTEASEDRSEDTSSADADRIAELEARVSALEAENSDLKEQILRKQADFENFRKRMQREKEESARFANKQLLLDILPVIDDFERAIQSAEESKDFNAFHDGIALIEKQFTGMLERKWGLKRFDAEGEDFDPQCHEAVAAETDSDTDTPKVLEAFQKGYLLHDKVLRSAKVKVSMPGGAADEQQTQPDGDAESEPASDDGGAE